MKKITRWSKLFDRSYKWKGFTVTFHKICDPEMENVLNRLESKPLTTPTRKEKEFAVVATITIENQVVYCVFSPFAPLCAVSGFLVNGDEPPLTYALAVVVNENSYSYLEANFDLVCKALRNGINPSIYAILWAKKS